MTDKELEFKKKLEKLIKTNSKTELAEYFGVSRQALYKWLRKYKIDYKHNKRITSSIHFDDLNKMADELLKQSL